MDTDGYVKLSMIARERVLRNAMIDLMSKCNAYKGGNVAKFKEIIS